MMYRRTKRIWFVSLITIIGIFGILGVLIQSGLTRGYEGFQTRPALGFYVLRHMNSADSMEYWYTAYTCIRRVYPSAPIIILDDNSRKEFVENAKNRQREAELTNTKIETYPDYPGRGEMLPYYSFYRNHPFEKAVMFHDSTFLNGKPMDIEGVQDVRYLWHFDDHQWDDTTNEKRVIDLLANKDAVERLWSNKSAWVGCFGVQTVIDHAALVTIVDKYKLFNCLSVVSTRPMRMAMERVFSVLCTLEYPTLATRPSLFGIIHQFPLRPFSYSYKEYSADVGTPVLEDLSIVKVWSGR
jgi:hypothetical protein